jgi:hypothetical protein
MSVPNFEISNGHSASQPAIENSKFEVQSAARKGPRLEAATEAAGS